MRWIVAIALVMCVGITNAYNFMDGINGITGGYSLAVFSNPVINVNATDSELSEIAQYLTTGIII